VSRWGAWRAALDPVLPGARVSGDIAVGQLVRRRVGRAVQMGIVDPLVGGINAGHTSSLSAAVVAPQLLAAGQRERSLMRGLREVAAPPSGPVFLTVEGGMARLVEALSSSIGASSFMIGSAVVSLSRSVSGWSAKLASGQTVSGSSVVLACPARAASALVSDLCAPAAEGLQELQTASVAVTTMSYRGVTPPAGSGFLVPRREGRLMTACSWVGPKWPHLATPGQLIVRVSAGRCDDTRALSMSDDALVDALHAELSSAMGSLPRPVDARVHRWMHAFPQYAVGHLDRIASIEGALARDAPGIFLAGAYLRGVGVATCIAGGRAAGAAAAAR
jgi:oxygen-dependent protoporphyrinogen oxidase